MKKIFTFSHHSIDYTYRDFPSRTVAEQHRQEVGEELDILPAELVIETVQVSDKDFNEIMERLTITDIK